MTPEEIKQAPLTMSLNQTEFAASLGWTTKAKEELIMSNFEGSNLYWAADFKSLPPKLELIDGEAYRFDFRGDTICGIYVEDYNLLNSRHVSIYADHATNIKHLKERD